MAVEKVWKCDLCGKFVDKDIVRRVGVRTVEDRPDAADWIDVGPECGGHPVSELMILADERRRLAEHGE